MIRTVEELVDKIAEDLVWRRRELTDLRAMVQLSDNEVRSRLLIRSAVTLLYAHWEGFVKKSSSYYLEYVASLRLPLNKLSPNFIGLSIKSKYSELGASEKVSAGNSLAEYFCDLERRSNLPYKTGVDTKSNLSSRVLIDILEGLGLEVALFSTRSTFIDSSLVNRRNHIAHGEFLELDLEEYLEIHDSVIELIATYRNEIENASVTRRFEKQVLQ
jgi:hypothetical protein